MRRPVRIANASGFYGDRLTAMSEQVYGGDIDVVTGDYLAELTMFILWKTGRRDPERRYAQSFLHQVRRVLADCVERGIKIVSNAGGLDPSGLARELRGLAAGVGVDLTVATVLGDDLTDRLDDLLASGHDLVNLDSGESLAAADVEPVTANAYLGAWGIAEALRSGADIVVCGRVTDASLAVGPAAWWHDWGRDDWDRLAGAVVAGHVLECGAQATGGNFAFFEEIDGLVRPGFPIAEIADDGSSVITKHDGTGGAVTVETVTAQLLYEIDTPAYVNPDVVAHFDTIELADVGPDRVQVSGVVGSPPPSTLKVAINYVGGHRNAVTLGLVGLDVDGKAALVERALRAALGDAAPETLVFDLAVRGGEDRDTNAGAASLLTITAMDPDPKRVGRSFAGAVVELALANYPGFFATSPPGGGSEYGVYWPTLLARSAVEHFVVLDDGTRVAIDDPPSRDDPEPRPVPAAPGPPPTGPTRRAPLGIVVGARSGDKGGNANLGVWARNASGYAWLCDFLTIDRLGALLPEVASLRVERHLLPSIRGINFVIHGLLGRGVASSTRFDPQAKSLGEWLRSRHVDVPITLLPD